jgi:hypothetical protein
MRGFWVMVATVVIITVLGLLIIHFTPADDKPTTKGR